MHYLVFIFSLIQPVLALPFAMYINIKKQCSSLGTISIALAFATLAFTAIPPETYDLSRHYARIDRLSYLSLDRIMEFSNTGYYLFDFYAWLINSLHLPKEFFPASIVFASYYLVFSVFNDVKGRFLQNVKPIYIFLIFLTFWLSIGYVGLLSGLRNPFANIIIFYLTYQLFFFKRFLLFFLGSIFSFFIHPFAIAPAILVFFAYKFSWWSSKSKILIIIGFLLSISTQIISIGIEYISNFLMGFSFYSAAYFDENSAVGGSFAESRTLYGLIINIILPKIPILLTQIYLLTLKPRQNDPWYLLLAAISIYLGFFTSYATLYNRMAAFSLFIITSYLSLRYAQSNSPVSKLILIMYTGLLIVISLIAILIQYPAFISSSLPDAISKPLLFLIFRL